jgi:hypothetical protein
VGDTTMKKNDIVITSIPDYTRTIGTGNYPASKNVQGKIITSRIYTPKRGFINRHPTKTIEYAIEVDGQIYWRTSEEAIKI